LTTWRRISSAELTKYALLQTVFWRFCIVWVSMLQLYIYDLVNNTFMVTREPSQGAKHST